jgi:transcriptional regulator with XRE-family HTH domain
VTFAERLKELMVENGITNYQLSKDTGTHATTIANWLDKNKNAIPQERKFKAIADYFGVSVEYLKGETDIKEKAAPLSESDLSFEDIEFLKAVDLLNPDFQRLMLAAAELDAEQLRSFADLAESFVRNKKQ